MKQRFKNMSTSYKFLTVVILLCAVLLSLVFLPKPLAILLLIYAGYKIIITVKHRKYLRCVPYVFLLILGFFILDWSIYSNSGTSFLTEDAEEESDEIKEDSQVSEEITEEKESTSDKKPEKDEEILPEYTVESIDDSSFGTVIRKTLNIVVTDEYTLDDLYKIAKKEIKAYTKANQVNAIVAGFFTDADHIGYGYDMGRVEYVPNGKFSDAMNVTAGNYSSFQYVNYLEEALILPEGEELSDGSSDLDQIQRDFEDTYDDCTVTVSFSNGTLYVKSIEAEDQYFPADENAISCYTDWSLDHIKSDIEYLDITVERPSSSVSARLSMSEMETDNGRYFNTFYIAQNLK